MFQYLQWLVINMGHGIHSAQQVRLVEDHPAGTIVLCFTAAMVGQEGCVAHCNTTQQHMRSYQSLCIRAATLKLESVTLNCFTPGLPTTLDYGDRSSQAAPSGGTAAACGRHL